MLGKTVESFAQVVDLKNNNSFQSEHIKSHKKVALKVLIFLPSSDIGGTERMTITLCNYLSNLGSAPHLVLGREGVLSQNIDSNVIVTNLNQNRVRKAIIPLAKVIKIYDPDVVLSTKPDATVGLTIALKISGKYSKIIVRESNHRSAQGFPKYGLFSLLLRWAYRQADKVVAPSSVVAEDLIARYQLNPKHIQTIYNPVEQRSINLSVGKVSTFESGKINLLAVGRCIFQKGFDLLIESIALLQNPEVSLTILGDGPERIKLQRLSEKMGVSSQVHFAGAVENPFDWMSQADLFVLSSRWEGFPNALAEAMTYGLPIIATRCLAGPSEMIRHEQDGLLCEPNSSDSLAVQLKRLISDKELAAQLGQSAKIASKRFEAGKIAQEYSHLFHDVAVISQN